MTDTILKISRPRLTLSVLALSMLSTLCSAEAQTRSIPAIIDASTPQLMEANHVPGVSIALIQNHRLTWTGQYGVTSAEARQPVKPETIFEAASMSKPVATYITLQLVQEGKLDLDTPLVEYLGHPYIEDEPLHQQITARMVLSHRTGFPNWRRGKPLVPEFVPGTGAIYSGEAFWFLQKVIEHLKEQTFESIAREYLLDPIGMDASSYVWQEGYETTVSAGHTRAGKIPERKRKIYHEANTAYSLYTTPADYAKFLIAMMRPTDEPPMLLNDALRTLMLKPATLFRERDPVDRGDGNEKGPVYFGLGWRMENTPNGLRFCHSGSNGTGFRCYSEFIPESGNGIVIMTNSMSGDKVWQGIRAAIGPNLSDADTVKN
jgi:CubicO group peptidase (beta-lactamase class C family)